MSDIDALAREVSRMEIDFDKSVPFAEYRFREVTFPAADQDVTVRHGLSPGEVLVIPMAWTFATAPATPPALYQLSSTPEGVGYVKVRSTVAGKVVVLCVKRRTA